MSVTETATYKSMFILNIMRMSQVKSLSKNNCIVVIKNEIVVFIDSLFTLL